MSPSKADEAVAQRLANIFHDAWRRCQAELSAAGKPLMPSKPIEVDYLVTPAELAQRLTLDRSTIWRMVQDGQFPEPIQITSARIAWRWSNVLAWIDARQKDRPAARMYFSRPRKPTERA
jgi:prophage regulatory protein